MKKIKTRSLALLGLLALSLHANAANVGFNPASNSVTVGQIFLVGVEGSDFLTDLDGGGLNLSFDPTVLNVLDVLMDGTEWDFLNDKGAIDNVAGTVTDTFFNQFAHPKVGDFPILEYRFQAMALGSSNLHLTESDDFPFGSGGEHVTPMNFFDGQVNVVPEPGTYALLLGGLGVLGFLRMRNAKHASN